MTSQAPTPSEDWDIIRDHTKAPRGSKMRAVIDAASARIGELENRIRTAVDLLARAQLKGCVGEWDTGADRDRWCSDYRDFQNGTRLFERDYEIEWLRDREMAWRRQAAWCAEDNAKKTELLLDAHCAIRSLPDLDRMRILGHIARIQNDPQFHDPLPGMPEEKLEILWGCA